MRGVRRLLLLVALIVPAALAWAVSHSEAHTRAASPSRVLDGSYHSRALKGTIHYSVYLPPGYDTSRKRYPVIYYLHGLPGDTDSYTHIGFITRPVEQSPDRPAIVVGAQGSRQGDTDPEWHDWGSGRDWETATSKELVSVIDSQYRTIAARGARALIGISGGGYGAMLIGLHRPAVYSVIQSWSGYFHATDPTGTMPMDMGSKEEDDWASGHTLVPRLKARFAPYPPTFLGFFIGTSDPTFLAENRQFHRELVAAGIKHAYAEYGGGHTAGFWHAHEIHWVDAALDQLTRAR
jgi:enterochelin esterase-like enzyme